MSNLGPSLRSRGMWTRREAHFLNVLRVALEKLRAKRPFPAAEVEINRELYFTLLEASRELDPRGKYPPPTQEACNQPDPDDATRSAREGKRPDFQWGFFDPHESDPRRSAKQFVVECKRLGESGRHDWVLNENYVAHGIARFVLPEWSYAQRFSSALMVGYWQNMALAKIVAEINSVAPAHSLPRLVAGPIPGNGGAGVSEFEHVLVRPFPVSPFHLRHWWVDLR